MEKKRVFIFLFALLVLALPLLNAENNETEEHVGEIDLAYSCLNEQIEDRGCEALSIEDKIFVALAIGECRDSLIEDSIERGDYICWPSLRGGGECDLKRTAQATLALDGYYGELDSARDWILSLRQPARDLDWFLQIISLEPTNCAISYFYDDRTVEGEISIDEDHRIDSSVGPCLERDPLRPRFEINKNCFNTSFEVNCDRSFGTSLLFQKAGEDSVYLLSGSESSAGSWLREDLSSFCIGDGPCNYGQNLWAVFSLRYVFGENPRDYLQYLVAFLDDNEEYLPESFLHILTNKNEYKIKLERKQNQLHGYWNLRGNEYYDTALALLALKRNEKAIEWLLRNQDANGCWNNNNVRDTAFILYSVWPGEIPEAISPVPVDVTCHDVGYCVTQEVCDEINGEELPEYRGDCGFWEICCTKEPTLENCEEMYSDGRQGQICPPGTRCDRETIEANDTVQCCIGECIEIVEEIEEEISECELMEGICRVSCFGDEEEIDYDCIDPTHVCCIEKEPRSLLWLWIIILLVLIGAVVVGIIYKDKTRELFLKIKSKFGKSKGGPSPRGPSRPPYPPRQQPPQRMGPPGRPGPPRPHPPLRPSTERPPSEQRPKSDEMSEILRKLKESGK